VNTNEETNLNNNAEDNFSNNSVIQLIIYIKYKFKRKKLGDKYRKCKYDTRQTRLRNMFTNQTWRKFNLTGGKQYDQLILKNPGSSHNFKRKTWFKIKFKKRKERYVIDKGKNSFVMDSDIFASFLEDAREVGNKIIIIFNV
jgi:hypothetical protein